MITTLTFLFILGLLIIVHELGHFIIARRLGVGVEKFSIGFGPPLLRNKKRETEYCISAIPLGGFVKLSGDNLEDYKGRHYEYYSKPPGKRFWIIFSGSLLNYILGFIFFWLINFVGYPTSTTKVGGLLDGFGAKEAGIQINDKIIAVEGQKVNSWEELQKIIQSKKEPSKVRLTLLRNNREVLAGVAIKEKEFVDALGKARKIGLLGITPSDETVKVSYGLGKSFILGIDKTVNLTIMTYNGLGRILTGKLSMREAVTGPLGIFYITSKAARLGIIAILHLIAVLSVSLAIFNLLPLPVLDGGHILFLALEKLRGKTLSAKTERIINQAGLTLIIFLALFVTYNDILRFFGDRISKLFK
jgi:regulator of sigma E protease